MAPMVPFLSAQCPGVHLGAPARRIREASRHPNGAEAHHRPLDPTALSEPLTAPFSHTHLATEEWNTAVLLFNRRRPPGPTASDRSPCLHIHLATAVWNTAVLLTHQTQGVSAQAGSVLVPQHAVVCRQGGTRKPPPRPSGLALQGNISKEVEFYSRSPGQLLRDRQTAWGTTQ